MNTVRAGESNPSGQEITEDQDSSIEEGDEASTIWNITEEIKEKSGNLYFYAYLSEDGESSWIIKVEKINKQRLSSLVFPDTIKGASVCKIGSAHNNPDSDAMYNIWGDNVEPYHEVDGYKEMPSGITSIKLPGTVAEIVPVTFCGFRDLTSIQIPDAVTEIGYDTFYNCIKLKKVIFPASLESMTFSAFEHCKNLDTIQISKESTKYQFRSGMLLSKDGKELVWVQPKIEQLTIPYGVRTIGERATELSYVKKISIPESVLSIKDRAFNSNSIRSIQISDKNRYYAKSSNCIYDKLTHSMVVAICTDGNFILPKEVYYIAKNFSVAGKPFKKLTIPKTFKRFSEEWYSCKFESEGCIYFQSETPPEAEKGSFMPFTKYMVPRKSLEIYKKWYYDTEGITDEFDAYTEIIGY
jgi:hypothetical protein